MGDLIALETKLGGLAGMVIWGLHRDTQELLEIGIPMFSLGECPTGPLRLEQREAGALVSARVGSGLRGPGSGRQESWRPAIATRRSPSHCCGPFVHSTETGPVGTLGVEMPTDESRKGGDPLKKVYTAPVLTKLGLVRVRTHFSM